jgi:hypothetical protein
MRIMMVVAVAATFILAAWWNQLSFTEEGHAADVSITPSQRISMAFADLNLRTQEVKPPF